MMVRRQLLREETELRFAVAFGHVAEHLIVGAVLLHNVDDVLDRRFVADLLGDGVVIGHVVTADGAVLA